MFVLLQKKIVIFLSQPKFNNLIVLLSTGQLHGFIWKNIEKLHFKHLELCLSTRKANN